MRLEREGEHWGVVQKACSKEMAWVASWSRAGVSNQGSRKPAACQCCWSAKMRRMLGLCMGEPGSDGQIEAEEDDVDEADDEFTDAEDGGANGAVAAKDVPDGAQGEQREDGGDDPPGRSHDRKEGSGEGDGDVKGDDLADIVGAIFLVADDGAHEGDGEPVAEDEQAPNDEGGAPGAAGGEDDDDGASGHAEGTHELGEEVAAMALKISEELGATKEGKREEGEERDWSFAPGDQGEAEDGREGGDQDGETEATGVLGWPVSEGLHGNEANGLTEEKEGEDSRGSDESAGGAGEEDGEQQCFQEDAPGTAFAGIEDLPVGYSVGGRAHGG